MQTTDLNSQSINIEMIRAKNLIASILFTLVLIASFSSAVFAQEIGCRLYMLAGLKAMNYNDLDKRLGPHPSQAAIEALLSSKDLCQKIRLGGKYLRASLAQYRKGDNRLPLKQELRHFSSAMSIVWTEEVKSVETQGKSSTELLSSINKVQSKIKEDSQILLLMFKNVAGEKDLSYIELKNASDQLTKPLL